MTFPYQQSGGVDATMANVIPELWSATYLVKWHLETAFDKIVNTDYEGEFSKMGDVIHIRTMPDMTINTYYKGINTGTGQVTYERPTVGNVDMLIDQGKYWAFSLQDLDLKQGSIELANSWAQECKTQMHIEIESDLFADWHDDAHASNKGNSAGAKSGNIKLGTTGAPRYINADNVDDFLTDVTLVLDEQNVPMGDRSLTVPKFVGKYIKMSDKFTADKTGDSKGRLISGLIGEVDGLLIYTSNNVESVVDSTAGVTCYNAFANHKKAISFATQLEKNEVIRDPYDFRDLSRGLQVYGSKVTKAEGVVECYIAKG